MASVFSLSDQEVETLYPCLDDDVLTVFREIETKQEWRADIPMQHYAMMATDYSLFGSMKTIRLDTSWEQHVERFQLQQCCAARIDVDVPISLTRRADPALAAS